MHPGIPLTGFFLLLLGLASARPRANLTRPTSNFRDVNVLKPMHPGSFDAQPISLSAWQSYLPDNATLSSLSIPGTYQSMSYPYKTAWYFKFIPWTLTQSNKLDKQLQKGVRYLHLRLEHKNNDLSVYNSNINLHHHFSNALTIINDFFANHGGAQEAILVRIACNNCLGSRSEGKHSGLAGKNGNTREFWETLRWFLHESPNSTNFFGERVYKPKSKHEHTTLGDARGKIVIIQEFPSPEDQEFGPLWDDRKDIVHQDAWTIHWFWRAEDKVVEIYEHWADTPKDPANSPIRVNHQSASGLLYTPYSWADFAWGWLLMYIKCMWQLVRPGEPLGVVVGDYMTEAVTMSIIEQNFVEGAVGEAVWKLIDWQWQYWGSQWTQEEHDYRVCWYGGQYEGEKRWYHDRQKYLWKKAKQGGVSKHPEDTDLEGVNWDEVDQAEKDAAYLMPESYKDRVVVPVKKSNDTKKGSGNWLMDLFGMEWYGWPYNGTETRKYMNPPQPVKSFCFQHVV